MLQTKFWKRKDSELAAKLVANCSQHDTSSKTTNVLEMYLGEGVLCFVNEGILSLFVAPDSTLCHEDAELSDDLVCDVTPGLFELRQKSRTTKGER